MTGHFLSYDFTKLAACKSGNADAKNFILIISTSISLNSFEQTKGTYINPILSGFYPDPSICRSGDDYYLVNSSFAYFPGLPIFHSTDLVNWKLIGHAMDRPEQLPLIGAGVSRGLFAPDISYYKGVFYITCTLMDLGGNFVITATNPSGPWSNPTYIKEVSGIDPSLFFDETSDRAYIVYNSDPPENKTLWEGHRSIRMYEFDYRNKKVKGEEMLLVNGGVDKSKHPVWIEGPHIYHIRNWYYLMCAEGGTYYNHSEVIFRSKSPEGPFLPWSENPILTQRQLDRSRPDPITTTGHADLVDTKDGQWYAVFHGCRPYEYDHYNTGRETFLAPVRWTEDEWPVITRKDEVVQYRYPLPQLVKDEVNYNFTGNFIFRDYFNAEKLDNRYIYLRTVTEEWYNTNERKSWLSLQLRPQTMSGTDNPSFVGFRQHHHQGSATVKLEFQPLSPNEKAGLIIFQSEEHYYYLCKSIEEGKPVIQVYKSSKDTMQMLHTQNLADTNHNLYLRISSKKSIYSLSYSTDGIKWNILQDADAKFLSTGTTGGFVGCVYGMYATSLGKESNTKAYFDWFEYQGNDDVFK